MRLVFFRTLIFPWGRADRGFFFFFAASYWEEGFELVLMKFGFKDFSKNKAKPN